MEIRERCAAYLENERHTSWNVLEKYTASRVGIHLYFTRKGLKGYYENRERNRTHDLQSAKAWVFARIREKDGQRRVYGCTLFSPLLSAFLLYGLLQLVFVKKAASFLLLILLCGIFLFCAYEDERALVHQLKRILQK